MVTTKEFKALITKRERTKIKEVKKDAKMKKQIRNILSLTLTASILGACSNVDLEDFSLKQEKVLPKTTEVQLSNQTVMRIGSSSQYAAYKATEQEAGNAALTLSMDPVPAIPSNAVLVEDYKDQWGTNSFG